MASSEPKDKQKKFANRYSMEVFEEKIVSLLSVNTNGLNINQISQQLEINRNTVSKWLKALEVKNIIVSRKTGVSTLYYLVEKTDEIFPGPYVLNVELGNKILEIKTSNDTYLKRISDIRENLIGLDLFKFYPFNEFDSKLKNSFLDDIKNLDLGDMYKNTITFSNQEDKTESFSFTIIHFKNKIESFTITFEDLTLLKFQREQFLTSDSVEKILDLFTDSYISIQSDDHKVIMANKKTLDDFNESKALTSEPIYCFDLLRGRSAECPGCIGNKAIKSGLNASTEYQTKKEKCRFEAIPIESETKLKGYILVSREKL